MKIAIPPVLTRLQGKDGLSPRADSRWLVLFGGRVPFLDSP